jgi:signal transduction histidine kinase
VKELERLRAEWSSVIAHDLRQPVSAIALYAQLLARQAADGLRGPIDGIATAARRLGRMIQDLLDLSRLDARKLSLSRGPVDPEALVRASVSAAAVGAPDRRFEVRVGGAVPRVEADADRVAQVLDNLIGNAVKYGAPGTPIEVAVAAAGDGGVSIAVTNRGAGIPADELPGLFRRFHRAGEELRSGIGGIGLGLYIARALVETHGGRMEVESTPGRATTFRFTLPASAPAPSSSGAPAA